MQQENVTEKGHDHKLTTITFPCNKIDIVMEQLW